ncbi:MAG: DUF6151 family protein [Lautropia sp.]
MDHRLRCRCGTLQGLVARPGIAVRARCYCRDCQAYAAWFGPDAGIVDDAGGTEVVAMLPRQVRFTAGLDALACLSLSPRGILRWYAGCCRTPIGNTPRDRRMSYLGLITSCLADEPPLEAAFGPLRMTAHVGSARRPVARTGPLAAAAALARPGAAMLAAWIGGGYRDNPFFDAATGAPIRPPQVLSRAERERLTPPG